MKFSYSTHVLCSCGLGQKCPRLWRKDGNWNNSHGSAGFACRIPTSAGVKAIKRYGYPTKKAATEAATAVGTLLDLAADDATRARIGDLIISAKRGQPLPAVEDVRRRLGLGLDPARPGVTMAEWLEGWLAGKKRAKRASTYRSYESHVRVHILPVIGSVPLERVNTGHIEAVLAAVPGSAGTRHRVLATIRAALNAAVKQRQITYNPCAGIELEPENPAERQRWTAAEARKFITYVADDPMGLLYRIAVLNGERRGELCGLRWSGVDLDNGVLSITHTMLQLGGKLVPGTPKTKAGIRRVYLDAKTAELLRAHHETQELERQFTGEAWEDSGMVFCKPDGRPWNPDHVSKRLKRLAAQAGVPVITLHEGSRHTGNSLMRDAGVDQELRMKIVGHSDRDTNDRYTHTLEEAHRAAAEQTASYVLGDDGTS